jgi:predicted transcriptional regulator
MRKPRINDRKLLELIDKRGLTQSATAKELGVSRQAVSQRIKELRGKTTKAVVLRKVEQCVEAKLDAVAQLHQINQHANWLLEHVMAWAKGDEAAIQVLEKTARQVNAGTKDTPEWVTEYKFKDPHEIALRSMAEIRAQLDLQLKIFATLYDMKAVAEFQEEVLNAISEVSPDVRSRILHGLNQKRAIRSAIRFS